MNSCYTPIPKESNMTPLSNFVIIKPNTPATESSSGIIVTAITERQNKGKVIAVGPGRILSSGRVIEVDLNIGDEVVYVEDAATDKIVDDGDELLIMNEADILCVIG